MAILPFVICSTASDSKVVKGSMSQEQAEQRKQVSEPENENVNLCYAADSDTVKRSM
ncbi:hypothetical protein NEOLEDRAFT_1130061 [Neolentinus lepideus HHB14362 ss-1]|uniref:Uncharacterized protein n=1 Tax=Neolentinus lepideus HHB14362 ss-1 TaxID=1314782 RepID=A0A165UFV3_9AGAM|nr:hypothetical protein NEOLEDRAFT_1130061 [Neolentinus lepideus HHB14362 ss-1]